MIAAKHYCTMFRDIFRTDGTQPENKVKKQRNKALPMRYSILFASSDFVFTKPKYLVHNFFNCH